MTQKDENYLLQEICRNSGMGVAAINQVLKDVYDEEFAYELNVQADKMEQFARKAGMRLRENGSEPSEPTPIATAMLVTAIRIKELKNAIHKYRNAGIYATELAKEMVDFESDNLRKMYTYCRFPEES